MTALDLTPLFRSIVGFDRMATMLDSAMGSDDNAGYPPYNVEKHTDEHYRITMALAGFKLEDLHIVSHEGILTIQGGSKPQDKEKTPITYLHRGIATRAFKRRFQIADSIQVMGAHLSDGLLHIDLKREIPEAMKPREIQIHTTHPQAVLGDAEDTLKKGPKNITPVARHTTRKA